MDLNVLDAPFDPAALAEADTSTLKASLLRQVDGGDRKPMAQKVRFADERLMPLFRELAARNPTPDLTQQIPLLQGVWISVWSTNPFQDILPGRITHESYQIFDDQGYYANLARYKPGHRSPLLNGVTRWLLSYDLLIMQRYAVQHQAESSTASDFAHRQTQYWEIRNVAIQQALRIGSLSLGVDAAQGWFQKAVADYQTQRHPGPESNAPAPGKTRISPRQYQRIAQARPLLDNLYIDRQFRLVKTQREASQRPSYTIAVRPS